MREALQGKYIGEQSTNEEILGRNGRAAGGKVRKMGARQRKKGEYDTRV